MKRILVIVLLLAGSWAAAQSLVRLEYFFDQDPGVGNGTAIGLNSNTGQLEQALSIPISGLSEGIHSLHLRVQTDDGQWSHYDRSVFYISAFSSLDEPIIAAEYFFDGPDPGVGNATQIALDANDGELSQSLPLDTEGLAIGTHTVFMRVQGESGLWSLYDKATFTVDPAAIDNTVTASAEALIANYEAQDATYQWLDCDTSERISGATNRSFEPGRNGIFAVEIASGGQTVLSECVEFVIDVDDADGDGVPDNLDACPGTPEGAAVDFDGCEVFSLPADNFLIVTLGVTCIGEDDGEILIFPTEELNYLASINIDDLQDIPFDSFGLSIFNLPPGSYTLCIRVEDQPQYEQCFDVVIKEPESITVSSKVDLSSKSIQLKLQGSSTYTITVNDKIYTTSDDQIMIPLDKVQNQITVFGEKLCQGIYEDTVVLSSEMRLYPNPVVQNQLNVYLGSEDEFNKVKASVFSLGGNLVRSQEFEVMDGFIQLNLDGLISGTYVVCVESDTQLINRKIIVE